MCNGQSIIRPRVSILSPDFVYVPACATDIRARFDAERARLAAEREPETRRVLSVFEARRAEAEQASIRG